MKSLNFSFRIVSRVQDSNPTDRYSSPETFYVIRDIVLSIVNVYFTADSYKAADSHTEEWGYLLYKS